MEKKMVGIIVGLSLIVSQGLQAEAQTIDFCPALPAPEPSDTIVTVSPSQASQLRSIIADAQPGTTIYLEDGTYPVTQILAFRNDNVTLRSQSGNRDAVILDGEYKNTDSIIQLYASNVTIADLTIKRASAHLVHFNGNANYCTIYNLKLVDAREQFVKASENPKDSGNYNDFNTVACTLFELTDTGRDNVSWTGSEACYTGGIDAHKAWEWNVWDNIFTGIYCTGAGRGLAEHAIHFWRTSRDTTVERNKILNCARGIGFGMGSKNRDGASEPDRYYPDDPLAGISGYVGHIGGVIKNNFVFGDIGDGFDTGIGLEQALDAEVYHNTVYSTTGATFSSIDTRFENSNPLVKNNLVYPAMTIRGGGSPTYEGNIETASAEMFVNATSGDLHLTESATSAIDGGVFLSEVSEDIDGDSRDVQPDIGADEYREDYIPPNQQPTVSLNASPTLGTEPLNVDFSADASDSDGTIEKYEWDFDGDLTYDRDTGTTATTSYTYTTAGTYNAKVRVTDNEGAQDTDVIEIEVRTVGYQSPNDIRLKYIPEITASMKANLRNIKLRGDGLGREEGIIGQWGDSITNSVAYLGNLGSGGIKVSPENGYDYNPILLWMDACEKSPGVVGGYCSDTPLFKYKGSNYCNASGWEIDDGLARLDDAIKNANPSWSLTMYGTNDIGSGWNPTNYEYWLEQFIQINIDKGIVPVLSTIPPRVNKMTEGQQANSIIKSVAAKLNIPLVDLYGLYMELHPDDWADVLMNPDGVHPSHPCSSGDLSDYCLSDDGYNIRTMLTVDMAEKIKDVLFDNNPPDDIDYPIIYVTSPTHPYKKMVNNVDPIFNLNYDGGAMPTEYSWVLDANPYTEPDQIAEGTATQVSFNDLSDGVYYFHVRANSALGWGPTTHYPFSVTTVPTTILQYELDGYTEAKDTYITLRFGGDDNFGGASMLNLYNSNVIPTSLALFYFDLSGLSREGLTSASLILTLALPASSNLDYELYTINEPWIEGTGTWANNNTSGVVWNDGLTFSSSPVATGALNLDDEEIVSDVTNKVIEWFNNPGQNNGFMLQHANSYRSLKLIAKEHAYEGKRPQLVLKYEETSLIPGDVNGNGVVDILDLQACVNHFLGTQDWGTSADVNGDGNVDVLDVQEIVNVILGG